MAGMGPLSVFLAPTLFIFGSVLSLAQFKVGRRMARRGSVGVPWAHPHPSPGSAAPSGGEGEPKGG